MIELDGVPYKLNTPGENCSEVVDYINQYCRDNHILNTEGELVQIDSNPGNPLYMTLFGFGYLLSRYQQLLYSAGCGLSIPNSSVKQLEELCLLKHIHRKTQGKTVFNALVVAVTTPIPLPEGKTADDYACVITTDLQCTWTYNGVDYIFKPVQYVKIPEGESRLIPLVSTEPCSIPISEGTIQQFDTNPENLYSFQQKTAIPGQSPETDQQLRERLQDTVDSVSIINRAEQAIEDLEGVTKCAITMNMHIDQNETIGTGQNVITIPPRQCALFVQGFSPYIAETFYAYMNCLTVAQGDYVEQDYVTHSEQHITVNIISPIVKNVWVKINVPQELTPTEGNELANIVMNLSGDMQIGKSLTSAQVTRAIQENSLIQITGVTLGTEEIPALAQGQLIITPERNEIISLSVAHVQIEAPERSND